MAWSTRPSAGRLRRRVALGLATAAAVVGVSVVATEVSQAGAQVASLESSDYGPDAQGYVHVVGEVLNAGSSTAEDVVVEVGLFNATGELLRTEQGATEVERVDPAAKVPWQSVFSPPSGYHHHVVLSVRAAQAAGPAEDRFTVALSPGSAADPRSRLLTGTVGREPPAPATSVRLVFTFYDAAGVPVGSDSTDTDLTGAAAAPFELRVDPDVPLYAALSWTAEATDGTRTPDPDVEPVVAPPQPISPGVRRVAGADRYVTAAAVSRGSFPGTANDVFVVTGEDWPDALSASPAAAWTNAPLLPVRTDEIPAAVREEIDRLQPVRAWLIGGVGAVGDSVGAELRARGIQVARISGVDRYATAAAVAAEFFPGPSGAYYVSGAAYADALGGGAAAAQRGWPLLLTAKDSVPAATPLIGAQRIVLGGEAAVSEDVRSRLGARRVAGADRYATAAAVARDAFPAARVAYLATGLNFPDAVAGAPAAARDDAPLLLSADGCITVATREAVSAVGASSRVVLGGTDAVSDAAARLEVC